MGPFAVGRRYWWPCRDCIRWRCVAMHVWVSQLAMTWGRKMSRCKVITESVSPVIVWRFVFFFWNEPPVFPSRNVTKPTVFRYVPPVSKIQSREITRSMTSVTLRTFNKSVDSAKIQTFNFKESARPVRGTSRYRRTPAPEILSGRPDRMWSASECLKFSLHFYWSTEWIDQEEEISLWNHHWRCLEKLSERKKKTKNTLKDFKDHQNTQAWTMAGGLIACGFNIKTVRKSQSPYYLTFQAMLIPKFEWPAHSVDIFF